MSEPDKTCKNCMYGFPASFSNDFTETYYSCSIMSKPTKRVVVNCGAFEEGFRSRMRRMAKEGEAV